MIDLRPELLTTDFRKLSANLGQDPLQVQGPGGNTSVKDDEVMWIKASGTELANAGHHRNLRRRGPQGRACGGTRRDRGWQLQNNNSGPPQSR